MTPNPELRRAFERAREAYHAFLLGNGGSAFAFDDAKLMLCFAARLHQEWWWEKMEDSLSGTVARSQALAKLDLPDDDPDLVTKLAASPEWQQAWLADTGIEWKEIEA